MENEIQIRVQQEVQKFLSNPDNIIQAYQKALDARELQITEMKPKAEMYDLVMSSEDLREMSTVAKELNFLGMGRNNLFEYLKRKDVLRYNNEPYQAHVSSGYFKVIEQSYQVGDCIKINRKTMATSKGIRFIAKLLLKDGYVKNAR